MLGNCYFIAWAREWDKEQQSRSHITMIKFLNATKPQQDARVVQVVHRHQPPSQIYAFSYHIDVEMISRKQNKNLTHQAPNKVAALQKAKPIFF